MKVASKRFIKLFNKYGSLAKFDELNVLKISSSLYEELLQVIKIIFLSICQKVAKQVGGDSDDITTDWLLDYLEEYDPIAGYVFLHEVDRKKQYYQESLIATQNVSESSKKALRLWDSMCRQYSIEITDAVALKEYKDNGVKKVQWITNIDGKECPTCRERHKKIYSINNVPTKPHRNCRCRIVPYE